MTMTQQQTSETGERPRLWYEPAPQHFDTRVAWWIKAGIVAAATAAAILWIDQPVAAWALKAMPIPDLNNASAKHGDLGRELMLLEQWGQWVCSVLVIAAVALIDKKGRRRALAIGIGCLLTVLATYLLKDLCGRTRPWVLGDGLWTWGGPAEGFTGGSKWASFPSAHTTGAFALSCGLAWFYPRARGLFMTLAVITAVQRVLHGAHFVSDTLAGMGLAVITMRWTLRGKLAGRAIASAPPRVREWWMGGE